MKNKKQSKPKPTIDLAKLRKALAKLSKSYSNNIIEPKAVATLGVAILLIGVGYHWLSPFFTDISSAHVLNETFEEIKVLEGSPLAGNDTLLDLANDGFVYSSASMDIPWPNQLRYQRINSTVIIPIKSYGSWASLKFKKAKTDDTYVIWSDNTPPSTETFIYYEEIMNVDPLQDFHVPKLNSEYNDIDADIYNGTIAFIRTGPGSYGSIWTYIPGDPEPIEWPTTNSTKSEIRFDDNKIIWADQRTGDWDIWMIDLGSGNTAEQPVVIADHDQTNPTISKNIVVWTDDRDINSTNLDDFNIWMKDISTEDDPIQITTNIEKQCLPSIYNNIIVWEDWRNNDENPGFAGNRDVFMFDLNQTNDPQMEKFVAYDDPDTFYSGSRGNPMINNGHIFWVYLQLMASSFLDSEVAYTTYDELNLISPESGINFNFSDIKFNWELKRAGKQLSVAMYTLMANNIDDPNDPDFAVNLGNATSFNLKNILAETVMSDGTWEWWIKATAPELGPTEYFSQHRTINKHVAATLLSPEDKDDDPINESTVFVWEDIAPDYPTNQFDGRYIVRIGGFLDGGKYLYLPLPIPAKQTTFNIAPFYNLLKSKVLPGQTKEFTWSISGTKLPNPLPPKNPQDQWATLYYGDQWTFKVTNN